MRRVIAPLLLLVLATAGCDGTPAGSAGTGLDDDAGTALNDAVPDCPLTAAEVSAIVGQPMTEEAHCHFRDGKGVAILTVTPASQAAGAATYGYQRTQAGEQYDKVTDLDIGERSYIAVKDVRAEAAVVSPSGSYTVTMSGFERFESDPAAYEGTLRTLLDAVMG